MKGDAAAVSPEKAFPNMEVGSNYKDKSSIISALSRCLVQPIPPPTIFNFIADARVNSLASYLHKFDSLAGFFFSWSLQ